MRLKIHLRAVTTVLSNTMRTYIRIIPFIITLIQYMRAGPKGYLK